MSLLEKKDHVHENPQVRLKAVEGMTDPEMLVMVACTDDSPRVRLTAVAKLEDDHTLEQVARRAESLDARLVAVERIFSQGVIADLLKDPENLPLMSVCFSRISDRRIIESIAQDESYSGVVRRMAVEYFADSGYLEEASEAARAEGVEPSREQRVEAFVELYGGGLRGVRAIGRFRRSEKALKALGTIAQGGGETGGLAIEYLCSALASANPKLAGCAADQLAVLEDSEAVDSLIRAMDNPNLREPVRRVLMRIGTPQALAVLGTESPTS
jgi:hypothetical protein